MQVAAWRLCGGVSSFGYSGTIAHVVLALGSEKGMVEELFGATGIGSMRPEQYSHESPAPRG